MVVAGFGGGGDRSATKAPLSGGADLDACSTSANAVPCGLDAVKHATSGVGGVAGASEVVVDLAVAIVVFVVADFGACGGGGASLPLAVLTGFCAFAALVGAGLGEVFVDFAVAVVVFVVADFGSDLGGVALDPLSGRTELCA